MEAIYEFEVVDMPVTVAVDSKGTSVHNTGPAEWKARIAANQAATLAGRSHTPITFQVTSGGKIPAFVTQPIRKTTNYAASELYLTRQEVSDFVAITSRE